LAPPAQARRRGSRAGRHGLLPGGPRSKAGRRKDRGEPQGRRAVCAEGGGSAGRAPGDGGAGGPERQA